MNKEALTQLVLMLAAAFALGALFTVWRVFVLFGG
jgi:hypothetical protein